jgi:hypothetical protein
MKKNFRNSPVLNNHYLDAFAEYLSKETAYPEIRLELLQRVLSALQAIEQGERNSYYKFLKKTPTEHKVLEYIIERFLKKEYPALQTLLIDYRAGIFEALRLHKNILKAAVFFIIERELNTFMKSPVPKVDLEQYIDPFDRYGAALESLITIYNLKFEELDLLIIQSCDLAIGHICSLCDSYKDAFTQDLIQDAKQALFACYIFEQNYKIIEDAWGTLRLQLLMSTMRRRVAAFIELQKSSAATQEQNHRQNTSCHCNV